MKVTVVEHNPAWAAAFDEESKELLNQVGSIIVNIHHIGSTSVPDLMAKPIIDILLEVNSLVDLDKQSYKLANLAYEVMGELGIPGRRYFRKGGDDRTHQIHAFQSGDANLVRHLAFRDYLIAHKKVADEYGELKFKIAQACNHDIEKYCDEKDPFIAYHEPIALVWYKNKKGD